MARSRFIGYPAQRVLAVADDDATADRAMAALAEAGVDLARVERFSGPEDALAFDATGASHGTLARVRRAIEFGLMDQLPDMAWYEVAAREGRTVMSVPAADAAVGQHVAAALLGAGAHFINRYGRLETQDIAPWRGPEPPVDSLMKR